MSLSEDEDVIFESRLHWIALFKEILFTVIALAALLAFLFWWRPPGWVFLLLLAGWAIASFKGVTGWLTTRLILTSRRLVYRSGLLSKKGWELPVDRIHDIAFQQSALQRLTGSGDLLVESAGSSGRTALSNVPDPTRLKRLIAEAREAMINARLDRAKSPGADTSKSRAEQLQILANLHQAGSITDEEFETGKRQLLGDG